MQSHTSALPLSHSVTLMPSLTKALSIDITYFHIAENNCKNRYYHCNINFTKKDSELQKPNNLKYIEFSLMGIRELQSYNARCFQQIEMGEKN